MKNKKQNISSLFKYNTQKSHIILREYGRNIQNIINYIKTLKTKEERTEKAKLILKIMKSVNPKVRYLSEESRKLWDDLYIMSNYNLDITSEYPIPDKSIFTKKVSRLQYKNSPLKFKHYGRNIDLLLKRATQEKDVMLQNKLVMVAIRIMRGVNISFYNENSELDTIIQNIKEMTNNKLKLDWESLKQIHIETTKSNYKNNRKEKYSSTKK